MPSSSNPTDDGSSAAPDGGLMAWLQVAGAFILFFNTWGIISAFSVFQTYYESGELFRASSANISWIGSIQSFLLLFTGLAAGPIYDMGYLRTMLLAGGSMVVLGLMMLSLSTEYWQALLAQAFCIGIGGGLLFIPGVSVVPTWFSRRIGLALGVASSGSSLGGVVYPIVLSRLISRVGFAWAVRSIGFIALATLAIPVVILRTRVQVAKRRAAIDRSAFGDGPFMTFTLALFFQFMGQAVVIFYISYYPEQRGYTDRTLAFYIAAMFNGGSTLGRILPNAMSDHIGVFNTMTPFGVCLGISMFCLLAVRDAAGILAEAVVTGFLSGVLIGLPPVCFRALTADKSMIGTRNGQGFAMAAFGYIVGGPGAGGILRSSETLNWTGLWVFGSTAIMVGAGIVGYVRVRKVGWALKVKA
ncbi:monocarboxylate permease-like protein, mch4 [Stachybotrys elegans]|uniref:Monocarboxylate permease-like protein, mch4 n=1 Tax=Stachybotrys elegans TaxID=80388 RepID=A0A8K0SCW4_9HYPO|nr:monocarboxylate permease-like protein, mch4 [Stachybotrys elegans]